MMDNGLLKICPAEVPLDPVLTQQLPKAIGQIKKNVEWSLNKENMKLAEASEELHICLDRAKTSLSECLHRPEVLEPHLGEIIAPISSYLLNRMELCLSEHIHGTEADYKSAVMQHAKSLNILFKMIFSLMNLNGRERIISYFSFGYEVVEPVVMFAYHLPGESEYWEATYVCAAWLSKLCLIPTKIESVDNEVFDHKLFDRLLGIAKVYAFSRGQECVLGAALLAALISRRDVKKEKFDETISWIIDKARDKDASARDVFCSLQILNKIFTTSSKVRFSGRVMDFVSISDSIHKNVNSHYAPTRAKLSKFDALIIEIFVGSNSPAILDGAESYEQSQVAVVKRVMDNMFSLLEDRNQDVRCKTAKYAAYVACLIDPTVGEGMISFLMNAFDIDQSTVVDEDFGRIRNFQILSDKLWHGMCMYISEMIRASLVTDSALDKIVDIVQECIFFYYRSSDIEVGMQVREAACCVIWCIATTFSGDTLERVAKKVLGPLLSAAILDAEVTVRRASVTTLQELLKRIKPSEFSHELQKGVTHHSVASKVNSMGALAVNMSRYSDYSRDILKKILFHCLESKDRTVRISCSESLARITVEQNSWMLSILRRLNLMAKERSGYASHSAICTLYHIYNMLDRPSLSSDELYAATISVLMRHGNSEERNIKGRKKNIKLEILHSIAICKLIRSIYLNEHHLNFIVGRCEEENIRIHEVARNQLLLALESSDVGLQNEASLAIGALSMSSAAFCEIGVHENVINILENPADHKLNVLQRAVLCALSIVNIDSNIYEHEIDLLCHIASEAKIPGKQYTFCHSIRKSIIGGIGQFFSSLVLSSRPTTSLNSCLLKILKAAIDLLDDYTVSHEGDVGSQIREMTSDLLRTISPYIYSSETPVCRDPLVCVQPCIIRECVGKLLRLAVEKIGLVRESAGAALEVLIDNKYIEFEDKHILASIIGTFVFIVTLLPIMLTPSKIQRTNTVE